MENDQEHLLVIDNESYDDFNGFEVRVVGFKKVPYPLWVSGWPRGKYLLYRLRSELGKFNLVISKESKSKINHTNKSL